MDGENQVARLTQKFRTHLAPDCPQRLSSGTMELFVATGNAHKLVELGPALPGHILRTPSEVGMEGFEVEEDGSTFLENATKKASGDASGDTNIG